MCAHAPCRCRCLYPPACLQNHSAANLQLQRDPQLQQQADIIFMQQQCAEGHEGNLCARCSPGYGQRLSVTASKCRPCASTAQTVTLFILAAFASMGFIKYLCYVNSFPPTLPTAAQQTHSGPAFQLAPASSSGAAQTTGNLLPLALDSDAVMARGCSGQLQAKDQANATDLPTDMPAEAAAAGGCTSKGVGSSTARQGSSASSTMAAAQPKVPVGDLLKPFVIYLQVCGACYLVLHVDFQTLPQMHLELPPVTV